MEIWESDDYERPIETYPGYLGYYFDGSLELEPELQRLATIYLNGYDQNFVENSRKISLSLKSGNIKISFEGSGYEDDFIEILDQLPTVRVVIDNGPPDAGPASSGSIIFFQAASVSGDELRSSVDALAGALESDIKSLKRANKT